MNTQEQKVRAAALRLGVPKDILESVFLREGSSVMLDETDTPEQICETMARVCRRGGVALHAPARIVEHVEGDAGEQFDEALDAPRSPDELPDEFREAVGLPRRHGAGETLLHAITERY